MYVVIKGTSIKFNSTVSTLADANEKALDLLAGIGPESRAAECTESTRASPRNHVPSVPMPRRSYNKTTHVPGLGRGIPEPTTRASALIKAEQINLAKALVDGLISSDFQSAEEIYEKAFAVTEHHSQLAGSKIDEALRAAVQLTVRGRKDPIQQRSDRQVRRHKAAVKLAIMEQAGTRPEDQIAIAQAVLADLQGSLSSQQQKTASQTMQEDMKSKHDKAAKDFIIKSVQKTIALLKSKIPKGGRRTHADRTVMQTVHRTPTLGLNLGLNPPQKNPGLNLGLNRRFLVWFKPRFKTRFKSKGGVKSISASTVATAVLFAPGLFFWRGASPVLDLTRPPARSGFDPPVRLIRV